MTHPRDAFCTNAQRGTYGHECGKPATWIGTTESGYELGFCDKCKVDGHEARYIVAWHRLPLARAYEAAKAADAEWQAELVRVFGKDACNARYQLRGRIPSALSPDLGWLADRKRVADECMRLAFARDREARQAREG